MDATFPAATTGAVGTLARAALFTTRALAFRPETAVDDWAVVAQQLFTSPDAIIRVSQVHGRAVHVVTPAMTRVEATEADAIVCTDPARAIVVRVADCVPILIADRRRRVVAAIHAGWRGTCAGVATTALEAIAEVGIPASDLVAAIGPSMGGCCYQVDDRVRTAFLGMTPDAAQWFTEDGPGHWKLDLWRANADQLEAAGVPSGAIHIAGICTADDRARTWSYRMDGAGAGRMVAAIRL